MATLEQLNEHINKARIGTKETAKKAGDNKYDLDARKARKKYKRLTRKSAKLTLIEKTAELKKKPKKERNAASEG